MTKNRQWTSPGKQNDPSDPTWKKILNPCIMDVPFISASE